jgi:putative MFS transporter
MSAVDAARIAARLDRLPPSLVIWRIVLLASLGGVFEFYDLFMTGYVTPGMIKSGMFSPASIAGLSGLKDIAVSGAGSFVFCTFAGLWAGVILFAQMADWWGRRTVFTWSLIWYLGCTAIMAFQRNGEMLCIWRFIAGLGFGVQLVTIDTYICEIIPKHERGRAFSINQFITFCIVPVVALLAWLLTPFTACGLEGWRWVILLGSSGALAVWVLRAGMPESPRWLALHGQMPAAEAIMARIEAAVARELRITLAPPAPPTPEADGSGHFWELFSPRYIERTLMLSLFNMAQVIGFYGFAAWVPALLIARGVTLTHSLPYSFIIAIANPFGPLLGTLFADRLERKLQIILGLVFMAIFMAEFSLATRPPMLILLGVLFTLSANVMSYAYHSYQVELYPTRIRARAVGFVYSWSRIAAAFAGLAIGYFLHAGGVPAVAVFIAVAMVVAIVMIGVFGPHTGGRALEHINH